MTFWSDHTVPRIVNILIHIGFGTAALGLGLGALVTAKGGPAHRRLGTLFLRCLGVVLFTAVTGLAFFMFQAFLAIVTLLSFYQAFSGMRALRLRGARPQALDRVVSVIGFLSPVVFIALMRVLHRPWAPVLTYSILGGLLAVSAYDLARNVLPPQWLRRVWVQEHLVKMTGAYIAISSAFAGTTFPALLPWSAVVPSVAGLVTMAAFLLRGPRVWTRPPRSSKGRAVPAVTGPTPQEAEGDTDGGHASLPRRSELLIVPQDDAQCAEN